MAGALSVDDDAAVTPASGARRAVLSTRNGDLAVLTLCRSGTGMASLSVRGTGPMGDLPRSDKTVCLTTNAVAGYVVHGGGVAGSHCTPVVRTNKLVASYAVAGGFTGASCYADILCDANNTLRGYLVRSGRDPGRRTVSAVCLGNNAVHASAVTGGANTNRRKNMSHANVTTGVRDKLVRSYRVFNGTSRGSACTISNNVCVSNNAIEGYCVRSGAAPDRKDNNNDNVKKTNNVRIRKTGTLLRDSAVLGGRYASTRGAGRGICLRGNAIGGYVV